MFKLWRKCLENKAWHELTKSFLKLSRNFFKASRKFFKLSPKGAFKKLFAVFGKLKTGFRFDTIQWCFQCEMVKNRLEEMWKTARSFLIMHRRSPKLHTESNEKKSVEQRRKKSRSFVICVSIHFALKVLKIVRMEVARWFVNKSHRAADKRKGKRKPKEFLKNACSKTTNFW